MKPDRPKSRAASRLRRKLGQSIIEFTFVGIPMIFVLISIFEISRGMWIYHTLAYATKAGVRYAAVHGINCVSPATNTCSRTMAQIAAQIQLAGVGLDPGTTNVTFTANGASQSCMLNACPGTVWPPSGGNTVGSIIQIEVVTPFRSAIAMFWPGSTPVSFAAVNLPARSSERVQY
jgi:Flp pilus assembly protein TadG